MRIGFLVYSFFESGGVNTVVKNMIHSLSDDSEYEIYLFDLNPVSALKCESLLEHIHYIPLPKTNHRYPVQFFLNLLPIYRVLKKYKIQIAMIEGTDVGFFAPILQPFLSTKFIFCDHGALCNQLDNRKVTLVRYIASKMCCHTVVLTDKTRQDYLHMFHLKPERLSVIYNYVECPIVKQYQGEYKKIISIGRLTQEKGMDMLVEVADLILKQFPEWEWDVYGDGPMLDALTAEVQKRELEKQLHFKGNEPNAAVLMKNYSICVLPSYREGLPLVLIEALHNLLPAVSFDIDTGPRDIIIDGETGFLIPPYCTGIMAEKLKLLMESKSLRIQIAENCSKQIDKFDKSVINAQWKRLIFDLMRYK